MMETLLLILLLPLPAIIQQAMDPAPGLWQTRAEARNLDCQRLTQERAHELHPGRIPQAPPRGTTAEIDVVACSRRFVQYGDRPARDEVILSTLRQTVGEITQTAGALAPGPQTTWHVDAYYPDAKVALKISVAAKTDLAERGFRVSDKVPLLAAGDLVVLRDLRPQEAYALACRRYFDQQILGADDAFLGLMIVDPRETQLHAGICVKGEWRWLR